MSISSPHQESLLLRQCLAEIEAGLSWSDSSQWRHSHFEKLSDTIFERTRLRLSPVTLKRLWGKVAYGSSPSMTTLNALAQYLGYNNWIEYEQESSIQKRQKKSYPQASHFFSKFAPLALSMAILLLMMLATWAAWSQWPASTKPGPIDFSFEPVTDGIPNTVKFNYDVRGIDVDSVCIQQSWDPRLRHRVDPQRKFFASTYYYPGFFKAKLMLNEKVASEQDLFIKSNGWLATIEKEPIPFYLPREEIQSLDQIEVSQQQLEDRGYDLNDEIPYTNFHYVEELGNIPGNDFSLSTEFRNTLGRATGICQMSRVVVLCSEEPYILRFSIQGCVGELRLYLPGRSIEGQVEDLSAFGVDFSEWVRMELVAKKGRVAVKINGQTALEDSLLADPGRVVGMRYNFHGTGAVKSLEIKSSGQVQYEADF